MVLQQMAQHSPDIRVKLAVFGSSRSMLNHGSRRSVLSMVKLTHTGICCPKNIAQICCISTAI